MKTGGTSQSAQEQNQLDKLISKLDAFTRDARRLTETTKDLLVMYNALGHGADLGAANRSDYVTASSTARTVEKARMILKAAVSFALLRDDLTQAEADAILQEAYGNDTETTVPPDEIITLVNEWV